MQLKSLGPLTANDLSFQDRNFALDSVLIDLVFIASTATQYTSSRILIGYYFANVIF